jgi:hypothetical protein
LLRQLHPAWTPGQIKPALMTSASRTNLVEEDGVTPVDAFDAGSGRIALKGARDPGLTFDVPVQDYIDHQNDLWTVNYPNVFIPPGAPAVVTVQRTAHSELPSASTWNVTISAPAGVSITAPTQITVPAGGSASFPIGIDRSALAANDVRFAALDLTSNGHLVHLPITVAGPAANLLVTDVSASSPVTLGGNITLSITVQNVGTAAAPPTATSIYISPDQDPADGIVLAGCTMPALAAGDSSSCAGDVPFDPPIAPGTYYVIGVADANNDVLETDETDNDAVTGPIIELTDVCKSTGAPPVTDESRLAQACRR